MADFSLDEKNKQVYAEREAELIAVCKKKKRMALLIGFGGIVLLAGIIVLLFLLLYELMMKYIVIVFILALVALCFDLKMTVEACGKAEKEKREQIELLDAASPIRRFHL